MSNCLFEATLQKIEEDCNCTPKYFVDIVEDLDACEGKKKKCMNNFLTQIGDKRNILDRGEIKVRMRGGHQSSMLAFVLLIQPTRV